MPLIRQLPTCLHLTELAATRRQSPSVNQLANALWALITLIPIEVASQRWFDMVDWTSAHVGSTRLGVSRSIEGYTQKLEGEVHRQHPARTWVEGQEQKSRGHEPERTPITSECGHHLLQIVTNLKQGADAAAEEAGWKAADARGWRAVWMERGCSKLKGTPTDQLQLVVTYL
jgi:hypothetical protein